MWIGAVHGGRLAVFAEEHGHSLLELALGWLASNEQIASVIAGAMTAAQVRENVVASAVWRLSAEELTEVARLTDGA